MAEKSIQPLHFCANLSFLFPDVIDIPRRYAAAESVGFQGVECGTNIYDYALPDLIAARESTKLTQVQLNAFCGQNEGIAAIPNRIEEFKQCLELSIQYCKALNCKRLHIMAGQYPGEVTSEVTSAMRQTFITSLKYASERLELEHMVALIEPISTIENYFLSSVHQAVGILNDVNCSNVKLQLDLFHQQQTGDGNIQDVITQYFPYIGHIQVAQSPNRDEPSNSGDIDYTEIFTHLVALGYKGWIGCEYNPTDGDSSYKWLQHYIPQPIQPTVLL